MEKKQIFHCAAAVLKVVGAAGLIAAALVAPGLAQALPLFMPGKEREYIPRYPYKLTRVIDRLRRRKLIRLVKKDGKAFYQITEKGQEVLARYVLQEAELPRLKRWDRKWRLLLFDIAEKRKPTRENIRRSLEHLGMLRLQDSVWIYPYPCDEIAELLRTSYGVRHEVLYLTTERFLGDNSFVMAYGLQKYREE